MAVSNNTEPNGHDALAQGEPRHRARAREPRLEEARELRGRERAAAEREQRARRRAAARARSGRPARQAARAAGAPDLANLVHVLIHFVRTLPRPWTLGFIEFFSGSSGSFRVKLPARNECHVSNVLFCFVERPRSDRDTKRAAKMAEEEPSEELRRRSRGVAHRACDVPFGPYPGQHTLTYHSSGL